MRQPVRTLVLIQVERFDGITGGKVSQDAKNYTGKVQRIDKGGWFSTDRRLYVGRRDCTQLVHAMAKQVAAIRMALGAAMTLEFKVRVRAALCFVDAEWSLFAKPFDLGGVWIGRPKALGERIRHQGELTPEAHRHSCALGRERLAARVVLAAQTRPFQGLPSRARLAPPNNEPDGAEGG